MLSKTIKKCIRKDRDEAIADWVNEEKTDQERWRAIKMQKKGYAPRPYKKKDMKGNDIDMTQQAEATAKYPEKTMRKRE